MTYRTFVRNVACKQKEVFSHKLFYIQRDINAIQHVQRPRLLV